jgi:nicotinamide-nucleotide amidase
MTQNQITQLVTKMRDKGLKVAFAESSTAGLVVAEFANGQGTSDVLLGSIVTYSVEAKQKVLNVKKETIALYTPESQQVTNEMVMGLQKLLQADISIAITGLCGQGGSESAEKPVGSTFVSAYFQDRVEEYREVFKGDFQKIRQQTVTYVFDKLNYIVDEYFKN